MKFQIPFILYLKIKVLIFVIFSSLVLFQIVLVLVVPCTKILRYENHLIVVDFWEAAMVGFPLCWSWYSAPVGIALDGH